MKKSDIDEGCKGEGRGARGCLGRGDTERPECPDYDTCELCGRRVCKYVAIHTESDDFICRLCAEDQGWNSEEIATQRVDLLNHVFGEEAAKIYYGDEYIE